MAVTTANELRNSDTEDLVIKLREAKEELFNLRFQAATGQLDNSSRLKAVKRDIARIYTILRERELGIRGDVAAEAQADNNEAAVAGNSFLRYRLSVLAIIMNQSY